VTAATDPTANTDDREIQREILFHLAASPLAGATREGIVEWWVMERAIARESARAERALEALVASGWLQCETDSDGETFYRLAPEHRNEPSLLAPPDGEGDR